MRLLVGDHNRVYRRHHFYHFQFSAFGIRFHHKYVVSGSDCLIVLAVFIIRPLQEHLARGYPAGQIIDMSACAISRQSFRQPNDFSDSAICFQVCFYLLLSQIRVTVAITQHGFCCHQCAFTVGMNSAPLDGDRSLVIVHPFILADLLRNHFRFVPWEIVPVIQAAVGVVAPVNAADFTRLIVDDKTRSRIPCPGVIDGHFNNTYLRRKHISRRFILLSASDYGDRLELGNGRTDINPYSLRRFCPTVPIVSVLRPNHPQLFLCFPFRN